MVGSRLEEVKIVANDDAFSQEFALQSNSSYGKAV